MEYCTTHGKLKNIIALVPCKHSFCEGCIEKWMTTVSHRCPLCSTFIEYTKPTFETEKDVEEYNCYLTLPPSNNLQENMERIYYYVYFNIHERNQTLDSYTRLYFKKSGEYDDFEMPNCCPISVKENGFLNTPIGTTTKKFLLLMFPEPEIVDGDTGECSRYEGSIEERVEVKNGTVTVGDVVNACIKFFNSIPDRPDLEEYPYNMYCYAIGFKRLEDIEDAEVYCLETDA